MQRGIKKGICLLMASAVFLLTIRCANIVNNSDRTAAAFEKGNDVGMQKASDEKEIKNLRIYHQADWENGTVKIYWLPVQYASRYTVVCIRSKDSQKILDQSISAQEETEVVHEIEYGETYEYAILAYRNDNGHEFISCHAEYELNVSPSPILWEDKEIKTKKDATLVFYPNVYQDGGRYISPTGIQIFRGKDEKHMKLVHTVKYENLSDFFPENESSYVKKYVDKNKSHEDYYQIRTYIDIGGKREYGEKSEMKPFREKGYKGEVETSLTVKPKKPYIRNMEMTITNAGKLPIKVGMPYIKNYYKKGRFQEDYVFLIYEEDEAYPYRSSNDLKIDKIEYKLQASGQYKTLSGDATVTIKSGEKISLRFSRKNGKRFKNYLCHLDSVPWGGLDQISFYLFQYKGKESFIRIFYQMRDGKIFFYPHMENDESREPYNTYDDDD